MIDINEVLFHGTTGRYHAMQVRKHGLYKDDEENFWLTDNLVIAGGIYATRRGRVYGSDPVLLIASKSVAMSRAKEVVDIKFPDRIEVGVDYLLQEEYILFSLVKEGKDPNYFFTRRGRAELEDFMQEHSFGEQI